MVLSKRNKALIEAATKGYRITIEGDVISPNGKKRALRRGSKSNPRLCFNVKTSMGVSTISVHRLQAYQKFGDKIFEPGLVVRHLNNNCTDNSEDNIDIGTVKDNYHDTDKSVRDRVLDNATTKVRKLTPKQVLEIRNRRKMGATYKELTKEFKVCKSTISYVITRKTYDWVE